jgi:hypothetical protein
MPEEKPSLHELELRLKEQEIKLKEAEIRLKETEVRAKEQEIAAARRLSPVAVGIYVAALGLLGNLIVARWNNNSTVDVERAREQSALVIEAIKTNGDTKAACKSLMFFVRLGFVENKDNLIVGTCLNDQENIPTLPSGSNYLIILIRDRNNKPVVGATVHTKDAMGNQDNCTTFEAGECRLPPVPLGDSLLVSVEKGTSKTMERVSWSGTPIVLVLD